MTNPRRPRPAGLLLLPLLLVLATVPGLARAATPPDPDRQEVGHRGSKAPSSTVGAVSRPRPDRQEVGIAPLPPGMAVQSAGSATGKGAAALPPADFVILESSDGEPARVVAGNPALADRPSCPASTFKTVLAWVALEHGVIASSTRLDGLDPHLGTGTLSLDLHQALLFSSNAFFRSIAPKAGRPAIEEFLRRSGYATPPLREGPRGVFRGSPRALSRWLGKDWAPVVKGGNLRITPRQQQAFLERLATGGLPDPAGVRDTLIEALRWPSPDPTVKLFGKTGASDGAVWFAGFGHTAAGRRTVTVFCRGPVTRRSAVIAAFYQRFGLVWSDTLLPPLR